MNVSTRTPSRLVLTVAFTVSALLLGIIGAVAAGTGTVPPPPKIAFVTTNANVAPDALTVGPMAGRLGAPLFITNKDVLGESTKDALVAYDPDLIIVAGGPNTVTDGVLAQISAATGLAIEDAADTPDTGIIRVSGDGRDETAVALSTLIAAYNPKFLPTDATAADSDLLDGKDSTAFLGATAKATDADKLDGQDSTVFATRQDPVGFAFDQVSSAVAPQDSTDTVLASIDVTTADECGGGATVHTYRLQASAFTSESTGSALGEDAFPRLSIRQDATSISFATDTGFLIDRLTVEDTTSGLDEEYGTMHTMAIQTATPGAHTFNLVGDVYSGEFAVLFGDINFSIEDMGYVCS